MAGPLLVHQPAGDSPQFGVDGAHEAVPGIIAARTGLIKESGQVTSFFRAHRSFLDLLEID
jgi:hypothetical protein